MSSDCLEVVAAEERSNMLLKAGRAEHTMTTMTCCADFHFEHDRGATKRFQLMIPDLIACIHDSLRIEPSQAVQARIRGPDLCVKTAIASNFQGTIAFRCCLLLIRQE